MPAHPDRPKYLRTSDLARAAGLHPNTVRRYVDWGLLPPVERSQAGYRRFTQQHLDCLRLGRLILSGEYPGRAIRASGICVIHTAVEGDWGGALEQAYQHQALVQSESDQAEAAAALLEHWAQGQSASPPGPARSIGQAARLLGVSVDVLRNWERSNLLRVPRDPLNGYRRYGPDEISRLRVIRLLSRAGYSLMAVLRMLLELDSGRARDLRQVLDTPRPDEDVYTAADHWLSTLSAHRQIARQAIAFIEEVIRVSGA